MKQASPCCPSSAAIPPYYGDISLWQSIRAIISQPQSTVELHFLEPVAATETRQETARAIHALLSQKQQDLG